MIIYSVCNSCWQRYNLIVELTEAPLIKEISDQEGYTCPCPRDCGGTINLVGNGLVSEISKTKSLSPPITLSGKELYKALKGLGLPDEIPKSKEVIESLLKSTKIKDISMEEVNGKFYLHELRLDNGATLHLAAGLRGAQLLKITLENVDGSGHIS